MPLSEKTRKRLIERLGFLYGGEAAACLGRIEELVERHPGAKSNERKSLWSERDVVLITYGDQIQDPGRSSLEALQGFLQRHELESAISVVHLLPFCPFSSDDGFSVIDYRAVDERVGTWSDIASLGESCDLMFDLVLNHCSQHSEWFQKYLRGESPYNGFFIEIDPAADLSAVTRPRSLPLLTPFEGRGGTRQVWTTFSADQVDLNFANPEVLVEMLDVLLLYVARGARIIRLDAIAYLWKTVGTSCIHLPQTHAVVKVMRDILDDVAPGTILLTETNVPHAENVSYFGDGDEAQMVYQFSLAPLLLDAMLSGDAEALNEWLSRLEETGRGMTFFNFTSSHDGVGVRPLEGLVTPGRLDRLVDAVRQRGGKVSTKRNPDGSDSPYELNISYFSALGSPDGSSADQHVRRFLASQAVMLALRGIPGIYFHSLVGTENDHEGVERTGRARSINRHKFEVEELERALADPVSLQRRVFDGYRSMIATRIRQPAFHPDARQRFVDLDRRAVIAFLRTSAERQQRILSITNVTGEPVTIDLSMVDAGVDAGMNAGRFTHDLLSGREVQGNELTLPAHTAVWLTHA